MISSIYNWCHFFFISQPHWPYFLSPILATNHCRASSIQIIRTWPARYAYSMRRCVFYFSVALLSCDVCGIRLNMICVRVWMCLFVCEYIFMQNAYVLYCVAEFQCIVHFNFSTRIYIIYFRCPNELEEFWAFLLCLLSFDLRHFIVPPRRLYVISTLPIVAMHQRKAHLT